MDCLSMKVRRSRIMGNRVKRLSRSSSSSSLALTPKGYIPVSVIGMNEEHKRYMVHTTALGDAEFAELLCRSAEEYGYSNQGILKIPCEPQAFEEWIINQKMLRGSIRNMSRLADIFNGDLLNHIVTNFPESIAKSRSHDESKGFPVDILDTKKEYLFYMDVPGLSKSDIQVNVEEENTLVIKSGGGGKRKREEEDECKYILLERRASPKFVRKFRLPENSDVSAVTAKCDNGVLTIAVQKLPPPPKSKTVQVTVS